MTQPTTYLVRMAVFLVLVAAAVGLLAPTLWGVYWNNPGLNGLILLVLAVGIVFDDAIVVVEAIEHHIEEGLPPRNAAARRIWVTASVTQAGVQVVVEDTGPGVSAELAARLFDPFVTSKSSGMGLGLAMSRSFLRHQGGDLWFEPGRIGGARFVMRLPTAASSQQAV